MQKIKSLLKMAFAGALLCGFSSTAQAAYPALSTLNGRHNETCTRVLGPNYTSNTVLAGNLDPNSYFVINSANSTINNDEWLGNIGNKPFTYDQAKGIITFADNNFGSIGTAGIKLNMMTEDGSEALKTWYVTEEGNICIPNFTLYNNGELVATFTDIKVDGYTPKPQDFERGNDDGDDGETPDTFNWTVQTITDLYGALGPQATFKVKITEVTGGNYEVTEVDGDTYLHGGTLKFSVTGSGVQYGSSKVTIDGKSIDFQTFTMSGGVAMPNNSFLNSGNTFDPATGFLGFTSDSGFGFYDMSTMQLVSGFKLLSSAPATAGGGDEGTGEVAGDYEIYLQPVDMNGGTLDAVKVNVTISLQNEATSDPTTGGEVSPVYVIKENGTDYLMGQEIPFTWKEDDNMAVFDRQFYVKEVDDMYVWFTPFLFNGTFTEGQETMQYPFTPGVGFGNSQSQYGLGFFNSTSETTFLPETVYKAYYLLNAPAEGNGKFDDGQGGDDEPKNYPAITTLAGEHTMVATVTYENNLGSVAGITSAFPSTKTFEISENGAALSGFVGSGNTIGLSYDQSTGTISPKSNNLGSYLDMDTYITYNFGWANAAGEFTGLLTNGNATWGNPTVPTIQVDEYGNIIIPDFTIVNYTYNQTGGPVIVRYSNIKVDGFDPSEPAGTNLYFEDVEMEVEANTADAVTTTLDIELQANPAMEYQGFQFDVTVPEGVTVSETVTSPVATSITCKLYTAKANTYRVLGYNSNGGTSATGTIATLTLSTTWDENATYPIEDKIAISNVIFSSTTGDDIKTVEGYTGNITINCSTVYAEEIVVGDVTLEKPSTTMAEGDVKNITEGESLNVELSLLPEETTEKTSQIEWTCDEVDGIVFEYDDEGNLIVNTDGVTVTEPTEVTITGTLGDLDPVTYTFTINPVILGDSNDNGDVTVADVVTTGNYMVEDDVYRFDFPNANVILTEVGGEQVINSQDLDATIEIAFGATDINRNPTSAKRHVSVMTNNDRLVAENFKAVQGKQTTIGVALDNSVDYRVLQASVIIPEGMTVLAVTKGERAAAHELTYNILPGKVNIVLYSLSRNCFAEGNGNLFNLVVVADENCGDLGFENINAADSNSNGYYFGYDGGKNVTGTTGVDGIDADEAGARYYNLNGIEIARPDKGVYIRVNANGEAVKVVK